MEKQYWDERWQAGQIGFHEGKPNDLLQAHVAKLGKPKRVLVPLAGKAVDLQWLADRGHDVVGVEFVQDAIDAFFKGKSPTPHRLGAHDAYYANGVTLVRADFFDVTPDTLGKFDAIYDRAALVALEPKAREGYVALCRQLCAGGTLLITFSYDQSKLAGPPWSIDENLVRSLYSDRQVELLGTSTLPASQRLQGAGIQTIDEHAFWIG